MPNSNNSSDNQAAWNNVLWGDAQSSFNRRSILYDKAAHKALNIPYPGEGINASRTSIGIPGWTLPVLALIASLTYLTYLYLTSSTPTIDVGTTVGMEVIPPVNQVPTDENN